MPLTRYEATSYRKFLPEARARIENRDPKDVDVLALTLALDIPLWSNDRDFDWTGVQQFTAAQLLKVCFGKGSSR